jgi:uncharacterized protein YcfJ
MEVSMITAKFMMAVGTFAMLFTAIPTQAQAASLSARCEDYAYRAAYRDRDGRDVLAGTVGGAATGAVLGAILGKGRGRNIGRGAIIGGVAGTFLGAANANGGTVNRRVYNRAYNDCIDRNRVVRVRQYDDDVEYCLSRYRSYNPRTGLYRTYSGQYRSCP